MSFAKKRKNKPLQMEFNPALMRYEPSLPLKKSNDQKHDVPPHLKRYGLKRHSCFGCSRSHHTL